jgi:hypothetical protein
MCRATSDGGKDTLAFSMVLECSRDGGAEACPLVPLALEATTEVDAAGVATTAWTITQDGARVMRKTSRVANGVTSIDLQLGDAFTGLHHAVLSNDGAVITGNIDGQALAPISSAAPAFHFADQRPVNPPQSTPALEQAIERLLEEAAAQTPGICGGGGPATTALKAALWRASDPAAVTRAPRTPPAHAGPPSAPIVRLEDFSTPAVFGVSTTGFANDQNSLDYVASPACRQCAHDCDSWWQIITGQSVACYLQCFIPGNGCAQQICPVFAIASCDNNESCCGSICCGPGTVCGVDSLGACCPADNPVGCGDNTQVTCFPAGSTCCGSQPVACPPGDVCRTDVTGIATCCPAANVAADGSCCEGPACGGACCDGGNCYNGTCCYGVEDSNGNCCGPLVESICDGQCCYGRCGGDGSCCPYYVGSVTGDGTCCPTVDGSATVCGSACCTDGLACLDPNNSVCGVLGHPAVQIVVPGTGIVLGGSIEGTAQIFDERPLVAVVGAAFTPGDWVSILDTAPNGSSTLLTGAYVDGNGRFSVNISPSSLATGPSVLSVSELSLKTFQTEAEVDITVNVFGLN